MNQDDESFLSAYIDGELAPEQHSRVDMALDADTDLAERLRGLTHVRDLVAGLPHDRSIDVTARVLQRIAARPRGRGLLPALEGWRRGSRRILPLAGLAASAALLMVTASAAILMQASQLENTSRTVAHVKHQQAVIRPNPSGPAAPGTTSANASLSVAALPSRSPALAANGIPATPPSVSPGATGSTEEIREAALSGDAARVRPLLDSPNLKRFFWVGAGSGIDSEQIVASIIERTTHFDYFKITVAHGIVIDPRHPGEAAVLAFVVEPNQVERFNDQLKAALPGLVEQEDLDAGIATQLADMDRVQSFAPASLGEVEIPREALALRTRPIAGGEKVQGDQDAIPPKEAAGRAGTAADRKTALAQGALASASESGGVTSQTASQAGIDRRALQSAEPGALDSREPAAEASSQPALEHKSVVLVWVARPAAN